MLGFSFDEDIVVRDDLGYMRKEDVFNFEGARHFLEGIVKAVYETGDVYMLEHCLDELCYIMDVEQSDKDPQIEKKNENRLMHFYLGYQRAHIEQMKGGAA